MSVLCLGEVWLELNAATAPELTETFRAVSYTHLTLPTNSLV